MVEEYKVQNDVMETETIEASLSNVEVESTAAI